MIRFNELYITHKGDTLVIDVSVKDSPYYTNVYIDTVTIDTQNTFTENTPSSSPVYTKTIDGNQKTLRLELGKDSIVPSLVDNMFFVWIRTKGIPSSETPCGEDNSLVLGVAIPMYLLYQHAFSYMKELEMTCSVPKGFIDFILKLKALQISVNTGHYVQAIKYWNKYFTDMKNSISSNKCGCYGRYGI